MSCLLFWGQVKAFAFTLYISQKHEGDVFPLVQKNASLESSLNSLRALNEFLAQPGKPHPSDIHAGMLRSIGYAGPIEPFLEKNEHREISQMFSHLTANRNTKRNKKKNWPIARYLKSMMDALTPIILFFQNTIYQNDAEYRMRIEESQKRHLEWLNFMEKSMSPKTSQGSPVYCS